MRAIIFLLTFSMFVAGLIWRMEQVMLADKMSSHQSDVRGQIVGLAKALQNESSGLKDVLILSYPEIDREKIDYSAGRPFSRFQFMAQLMPPQNAGSESKEWQIISSYYLDKTDVKSWVASYLALALKNIASNEIKVSSSFFMTMLDPQRKPFLLMIFNSSGNWYAGLLSDDVFQGSIEKLKGHSSTYFVVNLQGQALAHSTREYVGSMLTEDPIVAEIMKSSLASGSGIFSSLKGDKVQGLFEQVEGTNIFVSITTPIKVLTAGKDAMRMQIILLGSGMLLIGLAIFFLSDKEKTAKQKPPSVVAPNIPTQTMVSTQQVTTNADRMKAYTHVASSLSHELKPSLTAILGYAQLAAPLVHEEAGKRHIEKITQEARNARDVIQKLLSFAGEDKVTMQKVGLDTILNRALQNLEGKFLNKGIKLNKKIEAVAAMDLPFELVVRAFEALLMNSIEAMDRAPKKELNVQLSSSADWVLVKIEDSGEGISSQNISKVFDPFFTTRASSQHVGLGLSTAMGILRELNGDIQIESEMAKGTSATIRIPLHSADQKIEKPAGSHAMKPVATLPKVDNAVSVEEFKLRHKDNSPMDALIVDTSIERLIEGDIPDMPPMPNENFKIDMQSEVKSLPDLSTVPKVPKALLDKREAASRHDDENTDPGLVMNVDMSKELPPVSEGSIKSSGKVDRPVERPKIDLKKRSAALDQEVPLTVRRPGEQK